MSIKFPAPVAIRVLRDLTRYRTKLVQYQSSLANRIQRQLLQAEPKVLSDMIRGRHDAHYA
jgi:hypothetical protein